MQSIEMHGHRLHGARLSVRTPRGVLLRHLVQSKVRRVTHERISFQPDSEPQNSVRRFHPKTTTNRTSSDSGVRGPNAFAALLSIDAYRGDCNKTQKRAVKGAGGIL